MRRLLILALWYVGLGSAAPLPADKGIFAPKDAKGIALRIRSHSTDGKVFFSPDERCLPGWTINLSLTNNSDIEIPLKKTYARNQKLSTCSQLEFVCWFPDHSVTHFRLNDSQPSDHPRRVLLLPKHSTIGDTYRYCCDFSSVQKLNEYRLRGDYRHAQELFRDNKGRFCMTALLNVNGTYIQSNTLRFNGCPLPPRDFDPMDASPYTPRGAILQEERMQKRNREAERAMREAEARYRLLHFND
jgi:hypothetical protein